MGWNGRGEKLNDGKKEKRSPPPQQQQHHKARSRNVEQSLQFLDQQPFFVADVTAVEFLESVNTLSRDERVERIFLLQVPAVHGLVGPFDFDGNGRLASFADGDLLVIALDG